MMKRCFAVLFILLILLLSFALSPQPGLAYPDYSSAQTHDDLVALCGEFLDAYEAEMLEIYTFLLQQEDTYRSVKYRQFADQRIYYYVNGERSDSWRELPFRDALLAFRDRFQCTDFQWDRGGQRDLGPSLVLQLVYAEGQNGGAVGNLIYCPEDSPDLHVTGTIYEIPGHDGWYKYVIKEE